MTANLIRIFDRQFELLFDESTHFVKTLPPELLHRQAETEQYAAKSCGELILRSAAAVEQTFGGITANLWDDPFEWTLPETLSTNRRVIEYLEETEATRKRGFELFTRDEDLLKEIAAPSGETIALAELLLQTLVRAAHFQGRAFAARVFNES